MLGSCSNHIFFYEAILNMGYFKGSKGSMKDLVLRLKELRLYIRFLLVSLLLNRKEMVQVLVEEEYWKKKLQEVDHESKLCFDTKLM